MTKAVQVNGNALALAEYKLDGGQVLNNNTVKNYLVRGNGNITVKIKINTIIIRI